MDKMFRGLPNMPGMPSFGGGGEQPAAPAAPAAPAPAMTLNRLAGFFPAGLSDAVKAGAENVPQPSAEAAPSFRNPGILGNIGALPFQPFQPFQPVQPVHPVSPVGPIRDRFPDIDVRPPIEPIGPFRPPFNFPPINIPPINFPPIGFPPIPTVSKTATQLAQSAVRTLDEAPADVIDEATNTIRNKGVAVDGLLDFLERRVRVGEVLNQLAGSWAEATSGDFAEAFQMDRGKTGVMDAIVAIAILNDPQLDEEILVENTPQTNQEELLDNRVIVDQWPPGGTVMQPPYMVLVAVEYRDVAAAKELVDSIMGNLVVVRGMKITRAAADKLRGRG